MADPDRSAADALLAGLNDDLAHEYQAVIMYNSFAAMVAGIHRPMLKAFFEAELPEELAHAQLLADKITALGGTPTTTPAPLALPARATDMLRVVLQAETETVARYVERRKQAEAAGDYGLAADLDTIISDETKHREETEKLLRGLGED
jgi:bacterioferritin